MRKKVVVGLSGGVDSSVAAALLIAQGYEVEGMYLECYSEPECRSDQDKADALKVAIKLGIRFQTLDFRRQYKERVIEYFYKEYEAGRTPNPDVVCNREIKFGIFYDWAMKEGYDFVATGHYARIVTLRGSPLKSEDKDFKGLPLIARARDESKDQSYFLWQIPRDHLEHILFPLGNMLKREVRVKAKELGLPTAEKPDSMGICFMGEVSVAKLLRDRLGEKVGNVIWSGQVVGKHRGLWFYTIGQRGGWEMEKLGNSTIKLLDHLGIKQTDLPPLYVIGKDKEKNELIVGGREETMTSRFQIDRSLDCARDDKDLYVRIRNLGELYEVGEMHICRNARMEIETKEPIFGIAEGQSAVFYDKDGILVAGGVICM